MINDIKKVSDILKGVVAYVDIRSPFGNPGITVADRLRSLGACVETTRNRFITHVIFRNGDQQTRDWAEKQALCLVTPAWVKACVKSNTRVTETCYYLKEKQDSDLEQDLEVLLRHVPESNKLEFDKFVPDSPDLLAKKTIINCDFIRCPKTPPGMKLFRSRFENHIEQTSVAINHELTKTSVESSRFEYSISSLLPTQPLVSSSQVDIQPVELPQTPSNTFSTEPQNSPTFEFEKPPPGWRRLPSSTYCELPLSPIQIDADIPASPSHRTPHEIAPRHRLSSAGTSCLSRGPLTPDMLHFLVRNLSARKNEQVNHTKRTFSRKSLASAVLKTPNIRKCLATPETTVQKDLKSSKSDVCINLNPNEKLLDISAIKISKTVALTTAKRDESQKVIKTALPCVKKTPKRQKSASKPLHVQEKSCKTSLEKSARSPVTPQAFQKRASLRRKLLARTLKIVKNSPMMYYRRLNNTDDGLTSQSLTNSSPRRKSKRLSASSTVEGGAKKKYVLRHTSEKKLANVTATRAPPPKLKSNVLKTPQNHRICVIDGEISLNTPFVSITPIDNRNSLDDFMSTAVSDSMKKSRSSSKRKIQGALVNKSIEILFTGLNSENRQFLLVLLRSSELSRGETLPTINLRLIGHKNSIALQTEADKEVCWRVADSLHPDTTTHIISPTPFPRTINLFRSVLESIPVVDQSWIVESSKQGRWLPHTKFMVPGLPPLNAGPKLRKLFSSIGSLFLAPGISPTPIELKQLIELGGGTTSRRLMGADIVIGQADKKKPSVTPKWLLDSILQQQLLPFSKYPIN